MTNPTATPASIFEPQSIHVALIDPGGFIRMVNEPWRRYPGANGLQAPGPGFEVSTNFLEICDRAEGENSAAAVAVAHAIRGALQREPQKFGLDYILHSQHEPRWFRTIASSIDTSGVLLIHMDITLQKNLEIDLLAREDRHLMLLDRAVEGIFALERDGVCTFCNQAAATLLGYQNPHEIIGQSFHERHHHSHLDGTTYPFDECKISQALRNGEGVHSDDEAYYRLDGTRFPVEYWSDPIKHNGRIVGTVVTFLDLSERRLLEAEVPQVQKLGAEGQLEVPAHDFKKFTAVISRYGRLIEERLVADSNGRRYTRQVGISADRETSFTRQLLGLRKPLSSPILLDLNLIVTRMEESLRHMIGGGVTLTVVLDAKLPLIVADPERIEQVLMNLAFNAADAMPNGGTLVIQTAHRSAEYVTLNVSDNGSGMDQNTRSRIFEPFFSTKGRHEGTGLGLFAVNQIVEQSGGRILVQSEPRNGTSFTINLPAVKTTRKPAQIAQSLYSSLRGTENILVIEGEAALRMLIGDTLRSKGYTVLLAHDMANGMKLATRYRRRIALVLSDCALPSTEFVPPAPALPKVLLSSAVLYMSPRSDFYTTQRSVTGSESESPRKPFNEELLLIRVREALDVSPAISA